jgi:hypothetical protein
MPFGRLNRLVSLSFVRRAPTRAWEISNEILTDKRAFFEYEPPGLEAMWEAMMMHATLRKLVAANKLKDIPTKKERRRHNDHVHCSVPIFSTEDNTRLQSEPQPRGSGAQSSGAISAPESDERLRQPKGDET